MLDWNSVTLTYMYRMISAMSDVLNLAVSHNNCSGAICDVSGNNKLFTVAAEGQPIAAATKKLNRTSNY